MIGTHDPEGVEKQVLHDLVDFNDKVIFEVGCGEGRMTWFYADVATSVLGLLVERLLDQNQNQLLLHHMKYTCHLDL